MGIGARTLLFVCSALAAAGCGSDDDGSEAAGTGGSNASGATGKGGSGTGGADSGGSKNAGGVTASGGSAGENAGGSAGNQGSSGGATAGGAGAGADPSAGADAGGAESGGSAGAGGSVDVEPDAFLPLFESGERLRAVYLGEPGAEHGYFIAFYDLELDSYCRFHLASDGLLRCLPSPGAYDQRRFADAECGEPVYTSLTAIECPDTSLYAHDVRGAEPSCEPLDSNVHEVVSLTPRETPDELYREEGDQCSGPEAPLDGAPFHDAATVDPEAFVAGERSVRSGPSGYGVREILGEDGSRLVVGMVAPEEGACAPFEMAGARICLGPTAMLGSDRFYLDDECAGPELAIGSGAQGCEPPRYGRIARDELWPIEARHDGIAYDASASCSETATEDLDMDLFAVADAPVDPNDLPQIGMERFGDGRLLTLHNVPPSGELLTPYAGTTFYDTETEEDCAWSPTAAGGHVCIPDSVREVAWVPIYRLFANDDCSEPLGYLEEGADMRDLVVVTERDDCTFLEERFAGRALSDYLVDIRAVSDAYSGTVYESFDGECVESVAPPGQLFSLGESILEDLVVLEAIQE